VRWLFPVLDGRLTPVCRGTTTLGRDEDNQIRLEGTQVSRRHAAIQREGAIFLIRDLSSRNGVFVDGNRISAAPLRQGSLIRIGEWVGVVTTGDEKASGTFVAEVLPGYFAGPVLFPRLLPLERAAVAELPVVIQGETGTGKEGAARLAHQWSGRRGPFLALNCAALPEQLAEGELFGYRKGAFTGADRANPGHLRSADGGTLFLDEVADLPLPLQAKLLRALEQREVVPLGESTPVKFDVHLVTATQAPLAEAVAAGRFRADLFARLDGMTIVLPPLRERVEELPFLFMRFLSAKGRKVPAVDATVIEALCRYDWPYNMRELDRLARQLWALHGDESTLLLKHLPARISEPTAPASPPKVGPGIAELDSATVLTALRTAKGNIKLAAQSLGISRQRLYRMLDEAGQVDLTKLRS
jgi:transcriptional regulator with PAS, ATPase and Fis domain